MIRVNLRLYEFALIGGLSPRVQQQQPHVNRVAGICLAVSEEVDTSRRDVSLGSGAGVSRQRLFVAAACCRAVGQFYVELHIALRFILKLLAGVAVQIVGIRASGQG